MQSCGNMFYTIIIYKVNLFLFQPRLCEQLLPLLVNLLLHINDKNINQILSQKINGFFSRHWSLTVPKYTTQDCITVKKEAVKCMLNVVGFVRLQKSYAAKAKMR